MPISKQNVLTSMLKYKDENRLLLTISTLNVELTSIKTYYVTCAQLSEGAASKDEFCLDIVPTALDEELAKAAGAPNVMCCIVWGR